MEIQKRIEDLFPELIEMRRTFHRFPELGTEEVKTGKQICRYLENWGISFQYPVADTGVVAIITGKGCGKGNTVALRADIDALPLCEPSDRPYTSKNPGVMHACGHDAHTAIALGTAKLLKEMEDHWSGIVKFFFQPAEETIGGARRMVESGCMENPHVDYVTGLHVMPGHKTGDIEIRHGKLNASSDDVRIGIYGKSCHGAYPDTGKDAIVIASSVISALQTLVSRGISPLNQAVFTLGTIHGGNAGNIVADKVEMTGTLRTTDQSTREFAVSYIKNQVKHICEAFGGEGTVEIIPGYAALINTDEIVDVLADMASEIIGTNHIKNKEFPSLGVEDFSFFLEKAPGVFYHLGCRNEEKGIIAPLHSNLFDIDEECLKLGVRLQTELALRLLKK